MGFSAELSKQNPPAYFSLYLDDFFCMEKAALWQEKLTIEKTHIFLSCILLLPDPSSFSLQDFFHAAAYLAPRDRMVAYWGAGFLFGCLYPEVIITGRLHGLQFNWALPWT